MGRVRTWLIAFALLLIVVVAALWLGRKPLANGYANRLLAARGVPARYAIAELGFGRQRLTDVVIGDPAHPDLVADWIEVATSVGFGTVSVDGISAGRVRMRGRLVGGRISVGVIDRVLPAPSGRPFALPALELAVADGRMRLETPAGVVGVKLAGHGRLDDGFRGTVAAVSERLAAGGCAAEGVGAVGKLAIDAAAPRFVGPVRIARAACGGAAVRDARADLDAALGAALDRWRGSARVAVGAAGGAGYRVTRIGGRIGFDGGPLATEGEVALGAGPGAGGGATAAGARIAGRYRFGARAVFAGEAGVTRARLPDSLRDRLAGLAAAAEGTPAGPVVRRVVEAGVRAGDALDARATVRLVSQGSAGLLRVAAFDATSASGASARLGSGAGLAFAWPGARRRLDGTLAIGGGGLPAGTVELHQAAAQAPLAGVVRLAPYAAPGARLALAPVAFRVAGGVARFATRATLSGPLGDGRIDGASLALAGSWGSAGLRLNPDCGSFGFERLAVAGLVLGRTATRFCPLGGALLTFGDRLGGGARLGGGGVRGTLGGTPLALGWQGAELDLAGRRFALAGLDAKLGPPDRISRLGFARLDGATTPRGLAGRFAGAAGQIGNVPLLLSEGAGSWTLADGALATDAALVVADAAPEPRFNPLAVPDAKLALVDGRVTATGTLRTRPTAVRVADLRIIHRLDDGTGHATLAVPGITFGTDLQPNVLTRLTFGVVADVVGTVTGEGRIDWTPAGVTSSGNFGTDRMDLAAAFGPVSGIRTRLRFTDLLSLETAPGQVASVATVNPGIPVTDGIVRYQLLPGARVAVEGARWPFAGGELLLDPALLDFSTAVERRMTFRVRAVEAGRFLQTFDYKNLDATGTFDGVLPMVFDAAGGNIVDGHMTVRAGGGTIAYAGEVSKENLGVWGNIAFQALRSLRYRSLDLVMNGPVAGEMVTEVRFAGVSQGEGAKANFLVRRLARLPFVFNVRIRAPFRALIDSARSFYDPNRLIERNLPQLLDEQNRRAVQPPASETVP